MPLKTSKQKCSAEFPGTLPFCPARPETLEFPWKLVIFSGATHRKTPYTTPYPPPAELYHCARTYPTYPSAAYLLFPEVLATFFLLFPLERIEMQTHRDNKKIDRLLRRFGLTPRQEFLSAPDGLARAGDFNIYEVRRRAWLKNQSSFYSSIENSATGRIPH